MAAEVKDAELLAQWRAGSRTAGSELIERHFARVHRFFQNKVGRELEDLIQQTFLACIEAEPRFEQRSSFVTFLLAIARYQLFSHYSRRHREVCDFERSSLRDFGTTPSGAVAKHEEQRMLAVALQSLPLQSQVLLELVYWEELSAAEVAEVLDIPVNTVYSRLGRARGALREQLQQLAPHRLQYAQTLSGFELVAERRGED
jgi:RNA polymerase sigma-70 factor (ECF subfamily)